MDQDDRDAIEWLLSKCVPKLTPWELDFLESIQDRKRMTTKQNDVLRDIWDDVVVYKNRD